MHSTLTVAVTKLNITVPICKALFGKNHHYGHRMAVGFAVMVVGVGIAKAAGHATALPIAVIGDLIGYAVHGLGLTPFLEKLLETFEEE